VPGKIDEKVVCFGQRAPEAAQRVNDLLTTCIGQTRDLKPIGLLKNGPDRVRIAYCRGQISQVLVIIVPDDKCLVTSKVDVSHGFRQCRCLLPLTGDLGETSRRISCKIQIKVVRAFAVLDRLPERQLLALCLK